MVVTGADCFAGTTSSTGINAFFESAGFVGGVGRVGSAGGADFFAGGGSTAFDLARESVFEIDFEAVEGG